MIQSADVEIEFVKADRTFRIPIETPSYHTRLNSYRSGHNISHESRPIKRK